MGANRNSFLFFPADGVARVVVAMVKGFVVADSRPCVVSAGAKPLELKIPSHRPAIAT
jgi:hypothetical protein